MGKNPFAKPAAGADKGKAAPFGKKTAPPFAKKAGMPRKAKKC